METEHENTSSKLSRLLRPTKTAALLVVLFSIAGLAVYIAVPETRNRVIDIAALKKLHTTQDLEDVVRILKLQPGDYSVYTNRASNPVLLQLGYSPNLGDLHFEVWIDDVVELTVYFDKDGGMVRAIAVGRSTGTIRGLIQHVILGYEYK